MLNRPFVYGGETSLQQVVVKEIAQLRPQLIEKHPEHKSKLQQILDTSGHIALASDVAALNNAEDMTPESARDHQWAKLKRAM